MDTLKDTDTMTRQKERGEQYRSHLIDGYITIASPVINNTADFILKQLPPTKRNQYKFKECVKMVCSNLCRASHSRIDLAVPMKREYYKTLSGKGRTAEERWLNRRFMTYTIMKAIRDGLEAFEYITIKQGAYDKEIGSGRYSRWTPTNRLKMLFKTDLSLNINYDIKLAPLVLLNGKDKRPDVAPNNSERYGMEYRLEAINRLHIATQVSIAHPTEQPQIIPLPPLLGLYGQKSLMDNNLIFLKYLTKRIFCRGDKSLKSGGRFYTMPFFGVMHPQGIPSAWRKHIQINGNPTIELDYSGLHIRMLYANSGIQYDGDPYGYENRTEMKEMMLRAVNAKNRTQAIESFNSEYENGERYYDMIKQRHPNIKLFADVGVELQRQDSNIIEDVLMHFTSQGICAIPIHDSVIVEKQYADELHRVMDEVYRKHMGGFSCPIK